MNDNVKRSLNVAIIAAGNRDYTAQLAKGLSSHVNVFLFQLTNDIRALDADFPSFLCTTGLVRYPFGHYPFFHPLRYVTIALTMLRIIGNKCNVLHITDSGSMKEIVNVAKICRALGLTVVVTLHDAKFHPGDLLRLRSVKNILQVLNRAHRCIVHGKSIADEAAGMMMIPQNDISVVPHGNYDIFLAHRDCTAAVDPSRRVLLFGRMKRYKGIDLVLQAVPYLEQCIPDARIIIAGKGPEIDRLQLSHSLPPVVELINRYFTALEIAALFSSVSVVLLPYSEASQSGPLNIAFSFSKPVIATTVGAFPETIEDGVDGLLVPPDNPRSLANAIATLLLDPVRARSMGKAARRKASTVLEWSGHIARLTLEAYCDERNRNLSDRMRQNDPKLHKKRVDAFRTYYHGYLNELDKTAYSR